MKKIFLLIFSFLGAVSLVATDDYSGATDSYSEATKGNYSGNGIMSEGKRDFYEDNIEYFLQANYRTISSSSGTLSFKDIDVDVYYDGSIIVKFEVSSKGKWNNFNKEELDSILKRMASEIEGQIEETVTISVLIEFEPWTGEDMILYHKQLT